MVHLEAQAAHVAVAAVAAVHQWPAVLEEGPVVLAGVALFTFSHTDMENYVGQFDALIDARSWFDNEATARGLWDTTLISVSTTSIFRLSRSGTRIRFLNIAILTSSIASLIHVTT
jgi:hypothetical protein